jgi:5-methylcytosine-specific restriction endonuclease McrA
VPRLERRVKPRKYCSTACMVEALRRRNTQPGRHTCIQCQRVFKKKKSGDNKGMFCGRECFFVYAKDMAAKRAQRRRAIVGSIRRKCQVCSVRFHPPSKQRVICSDECRKAANRTRSRIYTERIMPPIREVRCRACGNVFMPTSRSQKVFCSQLCARRWVRKQHGNRRHESRARRAGVPRCSINPIKVFTRDRWKCQLCGCATPRRLRGSMSPQAPELDHIIPIACGGGHVWENVHCACRACNAAKGAKPLGQLRLVG